jgi:hypothetical protein
LLQVRADFSLHGFILHKVLEFPVFLIVLETAKAITTIRNIKYILILEFRCLNCLSFLVKAWNRLCSIANDGFLKIEFVLLTDRVHMLARLTEIVINEAFALPR